MTAVQGLQLIYPAVRSREQLNRRAPTTHTSSPKTHSPSSKRHSMPRLGIDPPIRIRRVSLAGCSDLIQTRSNSKQSFSPAPSLARATTQQFLEIVREG